MLDWLSWRDVMLFGIGVVGGYDLGVILWMIVVEYRAAPRKEERP